MALKQYHGYMEQVVHGLPQRNRQKIEQSMMALIARFDLRGKALLSLGALQYDTFALGHLGGNRLYCFEDENTMEAEQQLELRHRRFELENTKPRGFALRQLTLDDPKVFTSLISRNNKFSGSDLDFDVLWVSGYQKDEQHRAKNARQRHAKPWHSDIDNALTKLAKGGWFIHQFAAGGVDLSLNGDYCRYLAKQLRRKGLVMLECYYLAQAPAIGLIVAVKSSVNRATKLARQTLAKRPILSHIYGQTELENSAVRVSELNN